MVPCSDGWNGYRVGRPCEAHGWKPFAASTGSSSCSPVLSISWWRGLQVFMAGQRGLLLDCMADWSFFFSFPFSFFTLHVTHWHGHSFPPFANSFIFHLVQVLCNQSIHRKKLFSKILLSYTVEQACSMPWSRSCASNREIHNKQTSVQDGIIYTIHLRKKQI